MYPDIQPSTEASGETFHESQRWPISQQTQTEEYVICIFELRMTFYGGKSLG